MEERTVRDRESQSVEAHSQHHVVRRVVAVAPAAAPEELHHGLPAEHHPAESNRGVNHEASVQQQGDGFNPKLQTFPNQRDCFDFCTARKNSAPGGCFSSKHLQCRYRLGLMAQPESMENFVFCRERVFTISSFERANPFKGRNKHLKWHRVVRRCYDGEVCFFILGDGDKARYVKQPIASSAELLIPVNPFWHERRRRRRVIGAKREAITAQKKQILSCQISFLRAGGREISRRSEERRWQHVGVS